MTTMEYLATPETALPQELAYGVLHVAESPTARHQAAVGDLYVALREHVQTCALGQVWLAPLDVILDYDKHLVVQPDLLFVSNGRSHIVTDRVRGAPDLVVEVLSPNLRVGKVIDHPRWFAECGVRECWHVHQTRRSVEVLRFDGGLIAERRRFHDGEPIRSSVLTGFERTLTSITGY
ncbi:MAG: Uma2 family endonuclease [Vicinamibacteraceae bacterium]